MKSNKFFLILFLFLSYKLQSQADLQEFRAGNFKTFNCNESTRFEDFKFSFNYPSSWLSKDPARPNIACKISKDEAGSIQIMVIVKKLEEIPEKGYLKYLESKDAVMSGLKNDYPNARNIVIEENHKIDGQNATFAKSTIDIKRLQYNIDATSFSYYIIYKDYQIFFSIGCTSFDGKSDDIYQANLPLFKLIANSFIICSKWK